ISCASFSNVAFREEKGGVSDFIKNAVSGSEKIDAVVDGQDSQAVQETPTLPEDAPPPPQHDGQRGDYRHFGTFNIIDKTIGKSDRVTIGLDQPHQFRNMTLRMLACWAPFELKGKPEYKALVEV